MAPAGRHPAFDRRKPVTRAAQLSPMKFGPPPGAMNPAARKAPVAAGNKNARDNIVTM